MLDSSVTSPVLNDLYWAADVVEKQILNALSIKPFGYNPASLLLYILSLLAFYVAVMIGVRRMDREKTAL